MNEVHSSVVDTVPNGAHSNGIVASHGTETSDNGAADEEAEEVDDELFGEEDGGADAASAEEQAYVQVQETAQPGSRLTTDRSRQLDDAELDSGDDEGRDDRAQQDNEEQQQQFEDHEMLSMDIEVARQPVPEPSDGEVRH